jgi:predicted transcriptional regulator
MNSQYYYEKIATYLYIIYNFVYEVRRLRKRESLVLDEKDEKLIKLFTDLGMPRNLSKTIMYVSQVEECRSADIEQGADLRQPEVSIAMQELIDRGWIQKRDLKKNKKGRPVHIYKNKMSLPNIIKTFEQEKLKEIESIKNDLSALKTLAGKR